MKRSIARVSIAGQCVLLQNSLRIKIFDFFKYPKLPYESNLSRHGKMVKIIETRPKSNKKAPKWLQICKVHNVDKITLVFGFQ